jgi:hypothetical protein
MREMKIILTLLLTVFLAGCWVGGSKETPSDIAFFVRSTGVDVPSVSGFSGVQGPSDFFGDYSVAMTFSANSSDVSNLVSRLPQALGTNWTTTTQAKVFSVGGPTEFKSPPGVLHITRMGPGDRTRAITIDTNLNRVCFFHASW